jgi:hypothetical protein
MSQSNIYFDLEEIEHVAGLRSNGEVFDYLDTTGDMEKYLLSEILVIIHEQRFYSYSQLEEYMYKHDKSDMETLLDVLINHTEVLRLAFDGVYREMCEKK